MNKIFEKNKFIKVDFKGVYNYVENFFEKY